MTLDRLNRTFPVQSLEDKHEGSLCFAAKTLQKVSYSLSNDKINDAVNEGIAHGEKPAIFQASNYAFPETIIEEEERIRKESLTTAISNKTPFDHSTSYMNDKSISKKQNGEIEQLHNDKVCKSFDCKLIIGDRDDMSNRSGTEIKVLQKYVGKHSSSSTATVEEKHSSSPELDFSFLDPSATKVTFM